MKKLPRITLVLWGLMVAGYIFLPQIVLREYVLFPLVVILSILLPVSLWISVQEEKKVMALVLAVVFLCDVSLLLFALERNYSSRKILESGSAKKGIIPEIAALLANDKQPAKSRIAANVIYRHHGVVVPFATGAGSFAVHQPTQKDKEDYRRNFQRNVEVDVAAMNAESQFLTAFLLLSLHVGIFVLVLLFLLIYEKKTPPDHRQSGHPVC